MEFRSGSGKPALSSRKLSRYNPRKKERFCDRFRKNLSNVAKPSMSTVTTDNGECQQLRDNLKNVEAFVSEIRAANEKCVKPLEEQQGCSLSGTDPRLGTQMEEFVQQIEEANVALDDDLETTTPVVTARIEEEEEEEEEALQPEEELKTDESPSKLSLPSNVFTCTPFKVGLTECVLPISSRALKQQRSLNHGFLDGNALKKLRNDSDAARRDIERKLAGEEEHFENVRQARQQYRRSFEALVTKEVNFVYSSTPTPPSN